MGGWVPGAASVGPVADAGAAGDHGRTRRIAQTANLARREADLALRHHPPEGGDLYIVKVGVFACGVYARRGADSTAWVTHTEEQAHYPTARWVQQQLRETGGGVALRASNMPMQYAAIRAGAGRGVLPCYAADEDPLLERLTDPVPEIAAEYWVIVHRDLRRAACVRAVIDWIRRLFDQERDALAGIGAPDPRRSAAPAAPTTPDRRGAAD